MKTFHRAIALVLAVCIVISITLTANATVFTDVDADALGQEAFDAIMYVSDNGIMTGNGNGTFTPNAAMTRAQFAKLLYNHSGASGSYGSVPFMDVPTGAWYYDAVSWAYNNGIVNGYTDTLFNPNGAVTREQTVTMLYRYATDYLGYSFSVPSTLITSHSDYANISTYARTPMNWALAYNIIIPASSSSALLPKTNTIRSTIAEYMFAFEVHVVGYSVEKRLNFINSKTAFGIDSSNPRYYISADMLIRLRNYVNSYYGAGSETANTWITAIEKEIDEIWGGACHGVTMVTYLDAQGKIDFNANTGSYSTMNSIPAPRQNERVKSGIHYYQITYQMGAQFAHQYKKGNSNANFISGVNDLIAEVEENGSAVFAYAYTKSDGVTHDNAHTVLVTDIVYTGGQTYSVTILNPNVIGKSTKTLTLNSSTGSMVFDGKNIHVFTYFSKESVNQMSFFDVDGEYNNRSITGGTAASVSLQQCNTPEGTMLTDGTNSPIIDFSGKMLVELPYAPFELENAAGEHLSYANGKLSGNMAVYSDIFLSNGEGYNASMLLIIDDTSSISYTTNTGSGSIFACGNDYSVSVSGSGVSGVYASSSEYEVYGENIDCTLKVSTKIDGWEFLVLNCSADRQISLRHDEDFCLTGINGEYSLYFSNYSFARSPEITFLPDTATVLLDLSRLEAEGTVSIKDSSRKEKTVALTCAYPGSNEPGGALE